MWGLQLKAVCWLGVAVCVFLLLAAGLCSVTIFSSIPPIAENDLCFGLVFIIGLWFGFFPRFIKAQNGAERFGLVGFGRLWF